MKWLDSSEIVVGLIAQGKIAAGAVDVTRLHSPHDEMVKLIRKHGKRDIPSLLVDKFGHALAQEVLAAAESATVKADYLDVLYHAHTAHMSGTDFERLGKSLQQGNEMDWSLHQNATARLSTTNGEFASMDQIEARKEHFQLTHLDLIDRFMPGMPASGLWTLGARPKEGKTSLMLDVAHALAKAEEYSLIFSFEMRPDELKARYVELRHPTRKQMQYVKVYQGNERLDPDGVASRAVQMSGSLPKKPRFIGVDYMDLLMRGGSDEQQMTHGFVTLAGLSWQLNSCTMALAQFNDSGYKGVPLPTAIRYGRMAVASSVMLSCLHHPARVFGIGSEDARLPIRYVKGSKIPLAYVIHWVSRFGFGKDKQGTDRDMGAVAAQWAGSSGWGAPVDYTPLQGFAI